jgi:hypothetical protein
VKPAIRIHIEELTANEKRTLFIDVKDLPPGMTAKKCALWMLEKAQTAKELAEPDQAKGK